MPEHGLHRIIDIVTGVQPRELIFDSYSAASHWLERYAVSAEYKQQHYRIVPMVKVA